VELPTPAARYLGPADRDLLAAMRCSSGVWFEDEVEKFIQTRLADYHDWRQSHTDHTIVGLESDDLGPDVEAQPAARKAMPRPLIPIRAAGWRILI
jgi:hypothetical protein